jgi:hypothetical protein
VYILELAKYVRLCIQSKPSKPLVKSKKRGATI